MLKISIAFLLGICILQILPNTLLINYIYFTTLIFVVITYLCPKENVISRSALKILLIFLFGCSYALYIANAQLAKAYPYDLQKSSITIIGRVTSLPQYENKKAKFNFLIEKVINPANRNIKKGSIQLTWKDSKIVQIGDKWKLTVRLKRPRGFASPGSFDVEKYYFSKKIMAIGYVVDKYPNKKLKETSLLDKMYYSGYKLRQYFYNTILNELKAKEFTGVILALVTGVQNKIPTSQWQVFRDTGTAHLIAISGLHVGFIAGFAFVMAALLWRLMPKILLIKAPAQIIGAFAAIISSVLYSYLAGFSVSTERACVMIMLAMSSIIFRRIILPVDIFAYALFIILILDPLVTLTASFWLSFVAVSITLYAFIGRNSESKINKIIRPNLVIAVGMIPLLLGYFNSVPLISPIANFVSVPIVNFFVVPFSLIGAICYPFSQLIGNFLLNIANNLMLYLWPILIKLQYVPYAKWQPFIHSWIEIVLLCIGILWLLAPKGIPGRIFGLCGFIPFLFPIINKPEMGDLNFTILDVGQGLSTVIETRNHILIYDTGPKFNDHFDAGEQVVWPFLRTINVNKINKLIISHADLDHSGGMKSLLTHVMPNQILTPKPELLEKFVATDQVSSCSIGQNWIWDGIYFEILYPIQPLQFKKNEQSCVLHVKTPTSSILLTGDIGKISEDVLINKYKEHLNSDIITVPHHGSKRSSSLEFIELVHPKYAVASVGYLNQYRHPHSQVVELYRKNGAKFINTVDYGTIDFKLFSTKDKKIKLSCYRIEHQKIWNLNNAN